jgi:hypothetical protein
MARQIGSGAAENDYHLPGVWAALLAQEVEGFPDPRYVLMDDADRPPLKDQRREHSQLLPLMLRNEPVAVIWYRVQRELPEIVVPRNVWPFNDPKTIRYYRVTPGDMVSPAVR